MLHTLLGDLKEQCEIPPKAQSMTPLIKSITRQTCYKMTNLDHCKSERERVRGEEREGVGELN